ncbi:hypothetical protein JMUB145_0231 [Staphylococcus caprae]|uniref:iron chaperone n=1 Tax=Staphylococcus caprae TaxID=29380 RepID=UPI000EB6B18F|nr:DUF1801 domain-containing protein [Staphylococcus caprae]BBD88852.1 hypothetical protein JMUB145_0231 [Staphylococcus caprae]
MSEFTAFLKDIEVADHREKMEGLFEWIDSRFPELKRVVKWNQPMYTYNDTFIIAFSKAKHHFSIMPEVACLKHFKQRVADAGYTQTDNLLRIKWDQEIDYPLIEEMITLNMKEKENYSKFWRDHK